MVRLVLLLSGVAKKVEALSVLRGNLTPKSYPFFQRSDYSILQALVLQGERENGLSEVHRFILGSVLN